MTFDEYQDKARSTAIYPNRQQIVYPALGLVGEAGETANKTKKWLRDDDCPFPNDDRRNAIIEEMGDCLWYLANLARDLMVPLSEIAQRNINKLRDRQSRDVLQGDGDHR